MSSFTADPEFRANLCVGVSGSMQDIASPGSHVAIVNCLDRHRFSGYRLRNVSSCSMNLPTILCVDDYETSLAGWCLYLQNAGFSVTTARTAQEGLQRFAVSPVDLVLLDYSMPDFNGDEVAVIMKRIKPDVRILMFSGVEQIPETAR